MYTWMEYPNASIWDKDTFETIEECVEDAKKHYFKKSGEKIYIGKCEDVKIGGVYFDDVLERVEEDMYEQVGEVSEGWDITSVREPYADRKPIYDKYEKRLEKLVKDYMEEIGETPGFYKVVNEREVIVE